MLRSGGRRGGRRGCGWPPCRWLGTRTRSGSRLSFLAASGPSPSTCWPRCWSGRARKYAGWACCEPRSWNRSMASSPILLTGDEGGERVLQELEEANAFVVALDVARSWFRYHHLFADLLQLELRRTAPAEVDTSHRAAARWFTDHVSGGGGPARPGGAGLGTGRPAAPWPTTVGPATCSKRPPCTRSLPGSPPGPARRTRSLRCLPRRMSWHRAHLRGRAVPRARGAGDGVGAA